MATTFRDVVAALLSGDNMIRREAETYWRKYIEMSPRETILQLIALLNTELSEAVKSIITVLLRGITIRNDSLWKTLSEEEFVEARRLLLQNIINESNAYTQKRIADICAAHAKLTAWPELMQTIIDMYLSGKAQSKSLSLYLLTQLAEYVGPLLIENMETTSSMIRPSLDDPDPGIRSAAAIALCSLILELSEIREDVCGLLTSVPRIVISCIESGQTQLGQDVLQSITQLANERSEMFYLSWGSLFESTSSILSASADENICVAAMDACTALLTNPKSASFCSNAESRAAFLNISIHQLSRIEDADGSMHSRRRIELDSCLTDAEDDDDETLAEQAYASLDTLARMIPSRETIAVCLPAASQLLQSADWRHRRAALLVICAIADGASINLQAHLGTLVAGIVPRLGDENMRVRYCALMALSVLSDTFAGTGDDDDDGEDGEEDLSFHTLFASTLPLVVCKAIEDNGSCIPFVSLGLSWLKNFFNPAACKACLVQELTTVILDFMQRLLESPTCLTHLKEHAVSVLANVATLSREEVLVPRYRRIMNCLGSMLAISSADSAGGGSGGGAQEAVHAQDISRLKGRSLEAIALVGKAVGAEIFSADAHAILTQMAAMVQAKSEGMDYSDPLTSYIFQTAARIAGTIDDAFEPFLAIFIPPVLQRLVKPVTVTVLTDDESGLPTGASSGTELPATDEVLTLYKRGVGTIRLVCNTHEYQEAETSCRVLYQYCLDIPHLVQGYTPAMVDAAAPLIESMLMADDIVLVSTSLVSEACKVFVSCCPDPSTDDGAALGEANRVLTVAVSNLVTALEKSQLTDAANGYPGVAAMYIVDALSQILKLVCDSRAILLLDGMTVDPALMSTLFTVLRDEAMLAVRRRHGAGGGDAAAAAEMTDEQNELQDSIWNGLVDAFGWATRIFGAAAQECYSTEIYPFVQGLLSTTPTAGAESDDSIPLKTLAMCSLIDAVEHFPGAGGHCMGSLAPSLLHHLTAPDTAVPCAFGLGVCAEKGEAIFSPFVPMAVPALLGLLSRGGVSAQMDPDLALTLQDNVFSSLLKICVFQGHVLDGGADIAVAGGAQSTSSNLLKLVLDNMPLKGDPYEARALHHLFVSLMQARDVRLLGGRADCVVQAFSVLVSLATVADTISPPGPHELRLAYWAEQAVFPHTVATASDVLKSWLLCSTHAQSRPAAATAERVVSTETIDAVLVALSPAIKATVLGFAAKNL